MAGKALRLEAASPEELINYLAAKYGNQGDLAWQDRANCASTDPEAFYPEKGGSTRQAKKVCRACEVREACLDYALERDERFGIFGGLSERERRKLRRQSQEHAA